MNEQSAFIINEESHEKIVKEDDSESEYESEDDDEVISDYNEMEDPLGLSEETSNLSRSAEETTSENAYDELIEVKQEFDMEIPSLSRSADGTASENVYDELLEVKQEFNMDIKEEPCFEVPITNDFTAEAWPRYNIHTPEVQNDPLADHPVPSSSVPVVPSSHLVSQPEDGQPPTKRLKKGDNGPVFFYVLLKESQ
ncbi:hypothetical protein B5X24_HaOG203694 [Helicoverpa armigera]|uniref:Uncharacterized protein n=1 Tax=Helicoverpa armigera TaxID=29058 RepID=A0A2W1BWG3_HELAM|nr:hypothetical protein B5X24_HaOG203694 [Helicoverpa armigera]